MKLRPYSSCRIWAITLQKAHWNRRDIFKSELKRRCCWVTRCSEQRGQLNQAIYILIILYVPGYKFVIWLVLRFNVHPKPYWPRKVYWTSKSTAIKTRQIWRSVGLELLDTCSNKNHRQLAEKSMKLLPFSTRAGISGVILILVWDIFCIDFFGAKYCLIWQLLDLWAEWLRYNAS